MEFYFAPMEGLTDRIFRRLHSRYFPGIDRYYMPFYSPTMHRTLSAKESRELPPAAEDSLTAIPQILTRNPEDFLWAAAVCRDLGYPEVNLNVGCPSGTVVAKGKGSGMLRDLEELSRFLDQVFSAAPLPVSIKTRIGLESPSEFPGILSIYNKYPLALLIVHPRVRSQYYKGEVNRDSFAFAAASSRNPLCYNGDILCTRQITDFARDFPEVPAIMIGRGLLANPGMLSNCQDAVRIEAFMERTAGSLLLRLRQQPERHVPHERILELSSLELSPGQQTIQTASENHRCFPIPADHPGYLSHPSFLPGTRQKNAPRMVIRGAFMRFVVRHRALHWPG